MPAPLTAPPRSACITGLPISLTSVHDVLAEMGHAIQQKETGRYISITNTESMYHGSRVPVLGEYIRRADYSLCDGIGVVVAGFAWGHRIRRLTGPALQLACSQHGVAHGWRHFFYGGKEGVADEMAARLKHRFPGLIVCGTYCPPFREFTPEEDEAAVRMINDTRPDIVWVGLGLPKQERWIASHLGRVKAPWMIGVGAAFDYFSGATPWAPPVLRRLGLEWVFRLVLQPRLRARRYWWSFIYVLEATAAGVLSGRFFRRSSTANRSGFSDQTLRQFQTPLKRSGNSDQPQR